MTVEELKLVIENMPDYALVVVDAPSHGMAEAVVVDWYIVQDLSCKHDQYYEYFEDEYLQTEDEIKVRALIVR